MRAPHFESHPMHLSAVITALCLCLSFPATAQTITGRASVIDGATLEIRGQRIRLHAIDAPESGQTCDDANGKPWRCGTAAARAMDDLAGGKTLACDPRDVDRYGRIVAVCFAGETDVGGALVRGGLALAYRKYGLDYAGQEQDAQHEKRGLWAGRFEWPWVWRKSH